MIAAALLWLVVPLVRTAGAEDASRKERRISSAIVIVAVPALAATLYVVLSNWDWRATEAARAQQAQVDELLRKLEEKLASRPNDVKGWLLLGKAYIDLQRYPLAVNAYQHAYDASNGEELEAIIGLGEALALTDEASLSGRAGRLFEVALAKSPNNPKALWYGGMAALRAGDLRRGRDRFQLLLAQNPPDNIRALLERQVQDLNEQLGESGAGRVAGEGSMKPARSLRVAVSLAPEIEAKLDTPLRLFVLARDPAGGPPLAVEQHSSADLPLTVELDESDAMMPTRTLASAARVQVVARLSRSGTAEARSGDFYGQAEYQFANNDGANGATLNIIIDRTVP
jgi:cytochrome c-type biogenesis protein CcmH